MPRSSILAALLALMPTLGGAALAQHALVNDPTVRQGFYAIGLADEIRKNCPQISPRLVRAYTFLKSLESYALEAGYSQAEIKQLTDNDAAEDALRAEIRADLAARGATAGNTSGFCAVGREEMARGTQAGRLLKAN
ncbi:hypothetical protein E2L08_01885 [Palleronia sediminis]|uniref:NADH dehydrogenase subunit E n=1 Tax=Palleronia sediminis TaxID=2547833 RepID=A0A4R6AJT1_9RHOB|nr:DUF5333 domain-containing protein [Palleronia sediminis]TDL84240.1 hypothetical protein E2L08_01885 [Palleronia sediminis]